jgi:hypothetical protein
MIAEGAERHPLRGFKEYPTQLHMSYTCASFEDMKWQRLGKSLLYGLAIAVIVLLLTKGIKYLAGTPFELADAASSLLGTWLVTTVYFYWRNKF